MATRGTWSIKFGTVTKTLYNHWDSYPSGLGTILCDLIRETPNRVLVSRFVKLKPALKPPTLAQQRKYAVFADTSVSTGSLDEWYVLLRGIQDKPGAYFKGIDGVKLDYFEQHDGLEQYNYSLDLNTLELRCIDENHKFVFALTFDEIREFTEDELENSLRF